MWSCGRLPIAEMVLPPKIGPVRYVPGKRLRLVGAVEGRASITSDSGIAAGTRGRHARRQERSTRVEISWDEDP